MCRAAFEKGLAAVGFSSHAPFEKTGLKSTWNMKTERLGEYIDEVRAARRRWEGKIAVYLGLEVDYVKGLRSPLDRDLQDIGLDYIIGSVHWLIPPHGVPFTVDGSAAEMEKGVTEGFSGDGEAMMHAYWDAVAEMIALGGLDIIGHLDLVKKNNTYNESHDRWFKTENSMRRAGEIAAAVSSAGIVVEVNTGGLNRGYFAETSPSPDILRLLCRQNAPVMISADAHRAGNIDGHYSTACRTLLDAGYASHVVFEGKNGGKPLWREVTLNTQP
jgi:histidinol-phosphatase (PHP family)